MRGGVGRGLRDIGLEGLTAELHGETGGLGAGRHLQDPRAAQSQVRQQRVDATELVVQLGWFMVDDVRNGS